MKRFRLIRSEDPVGISGVGHIVDGVVFADGQSVLQWINTGSLTIFKDFSTVEKVHLHGGHTTVEWID